MTDLDDQVIASARARLVVALDVDSLEAACELTVRLRPYAKTMKVGLELYLAEGPRAVGELSDLDVDVFLDLKLHDIPTTVGRAARVVGALGARYLTVHTQGGVDMVRACVDGLREGERDADSNGAIAVGVTVLTSDPLASEAELSRRVDVARLGGCQAYVCAGPDLPVTRAAAPGLLAVVPGIRIPDAERDDQSRTMTPREAVHLGADLLVVGRPITRSSQPERAAEAIVRSLI